MILKKLTDSRNARMKFLKPILFLIFVFGLSACKPVQPRDSDTSTTGCPTNGAAQELRRKTAMPDFVKVSLPILKELISRHEAFESGTQGNSSAILAGRKIVTMLRNMVAGNVHPLAFFATIADYETYQTHLGGFPWAEVGKRKWGSDIYRAGYCGSASCTGVFQVLVYGDWYSWAQDQKGQGLGFWGMKGGPDWASTLWWWTLAREENCTYLASGSNPCTTAGKAWTVAQHVRNGRRAYGQQRQCGVEWDVMYWSYLGALKNSSDPLVQSVSEISEFAKTIGLQR